MKLDLKYAGVIALAMALAFSAVSMQGQTAQNPSAGTNQGAQPAGSQAGQNSQTGTASTGTSQAQGESLADRARKAKAANRQTQGAAKPKVFNQDNFSTRVSAKLTPSGTTEPRASGLKASDGAPSAQGSAAGGAVDKVDILELNPEKTSITRPGGSNVNWSVQNKSEHYGPITLKFTVTGPCNYKRENTIIPSLSPGQGYTDNMLASVAVYDSDCAGQYTLELSASAGGKLLNSKTSSIRVQ